MRPVKKTVEPARYSCKIRSIAAVRLRREQRHGRQCHRRRTDLAHILEESAKRPFRGDAAPDYKFDHRLCAFVVECNNVLIDLVNDLIDQFVVVLDRAAQKSKDLLLGQRRPRVAERTGYAFAYPRLADALAAALRPAAGSAAQS